MITEHSCPFCRQVAVELLVSFDNLDVGVCRRCGTGHVLAPERRESAANDVYSQTYEATLLPGKAAACWSITETLTRGLNPRSVLDLGCGTGAYLDCARGYGLRTTGVEIAGPAVAIAQQKGHEVLHVSATDDLPFHNRFELVTAWDVLEHVESPDRLVANALASLSVGGVFVGVTPMMNSVFDRWGVRLFRATGGRVAALLRMCWTWEHLHRFALDGFRLALEDAGFSNVRVEPILLLSLPPDQYAGGEIMSAWTPSLVLNRVVSRAGVATARALRLRNKILFRAEKTR